MPLEHFHKLGDFLRPRLGPFGCLNAKENGVPIPAIQRFKKAPGPRIAIQGKLEVTGYGGRTRRVIGLVPAPVALCALHFVEPGRFHTPGIDQRNCSSPVDLRPDAFSRSASEFLKPELFAKGLFLPIDPSKTKRYLKGFNVRNRRHASIFLRQLQPHSRRRSVIFFQPSGPALPSLKMQDWQSCG